MRGNKNLLALKLFMLYWQYYVCGHKGGGTHLQQKQARLQQPQLLSAYTVTNPYVKSALM